PQCFQIDVTVDLPMEILCAHVPGIIETRAAFRPIHGEVRQVPEQIGQSEMRLGTAYGDVTKGAACSLESTGQFYRWKHFLVPFRLGIRPDWQNEPGSGRDARRRHPC